MVDKIYPLGSTCSRIYWAFKGTSDVSTDMYATIHISSVASASESAWVLILVVLLLLFAVLLLLKFTLSVATVAAEPIAPAVVVLVVIDSEVVAPTASVRGDIDFATGLAICGDQL